MPSEAALRDFLARIGVERLTVGGDTGAKTVTTGAFRILGNNPRRWSWRAVNLSANRGFLWFTTAVSASLGIPVDAQNGQVSMSYDKDGDEVVREVYAINQVASGTWVVYEQSG